MSSYTITITPDDATRASTTLRVDISESAPRITELLVRAGTATGLAAHQLPAVDLDLLLRAVGSGVSPTAISPASAEATHAESEAPAGAEPPPRSRRSPAPARRQRGGAKQAATKAAGGTGSRTGEKSTKNRAAAAGGDRAYRRAPADLVDVFQEVGGVTAVARHYGVPRHTAQSWVRRLRNEGRLPAPASK
jgi:hypothetical protein